MPQCTLSAVFENCSYHEIVDEVAKLAAGAQIDYEEVVKKIINRVYASDDAKSVIADVVADNEEETQTAIKPFDVIMISVLHSNDYRATVTPVRGTDVSRGVVSGGPFYHRYRVVPAATPEHTDTKVFYSQMTIYALKYLYDTDAPQLTNCFLQVLEATFNCVARHKEAFEYLIASYTAVREATAPRHRSCCQFRILFRMWLDDYKRKALFASIINPLLFLYSNCYTVFENLESHGASLWGAVIETLLNIPMPYETIAHLDKGWTWSAISLNMSNTLVENCIRLCMASVNTNWKVVTSELVPPPNEGGCINYKYATPMGVRMMYYSLSELLSGLKRREVERDLLAEFIPPLQRFVALCSPSKVQAAFLLHIMNSDDNKFSMLSEHCISSMLACDPVGNVTATPTAEFLSHVKSLGVDLESYEVLL